VIYKPTRTTMFRYKGNSDHVNSWKKRVDMHKIQDFLKNQRIKSTRPKFDWKKVGQLTERRDINPPPHVLDNQLLL
jgi:hypothetical protein